MGDKSLISITDNHLSLQEVMNELEDNSAGAVSIFMDNVFCLLVQIRILDMIKSLIDNKVRIGEDEGIEADNN